MVPRGDKKGQFYLLAAIVIVTLIIGLAGVSNYAKKKSDTRLVDLGEELGIEGGRVLEYGVYNPENTNKIDEFTQDYNQYAGEGKNLFFIYGDSSGITLVTYETVLNGIIRVGNMQIPISGEGKKEKQITPDDSNKITISLEVLEDREISTKEYDFELKPGENFYFIIEQKLTSGEEQVVVG